jgi:hypothetical protein
MRAGRSFALCTARSARPSSSASSSSFTKSPLPPTFASDTSLSRSPVVRSGTSSVATPSRSSIRRATHWVWVSASWLARVAMRSGFIPRPARARAAPRARGPSRPPPRRARRDRPARRAPAPPEVREALLALRLLAQPRHRRVQDLVHDRAGQRLDAAARLLVRRGAGDPAGQLGLAHRLGAAAQAADRRHRRQGREPAAEAVHLLLHDALGADRLAPALLGVGLGDAAEVVEVVEVHVVEAVHVGVDVARHADVDHEDRAAPPRPQRVLEERHVEQRALGGEAGEHHVGARHQRRQLVEPVGRGAEAAGQILGVGRRAVGDRDARQPRAAQRLERHLDHLAGPDQQRVLVRQRLEDLPGQVTAIRATETGRSAMRVSLRTRLAGEGRREEPRQHRPAGPALGGDPVGVLHLAQDLRLAHHQRVDRGRHPQQVADGVGVHVLVEDGVGRDVLRQRLAAPELAEEEAAQAVAGGVEPAGGGHHLHPVAGGEQHRLLDLLAVGQLGEPRSGIVDGEALAHLDRRRAVVHARQQDLHSRASTPTTAKSRKAKPAAAQAAASRPRQPIAKRASTSAA